MCLRKYKKTLGPKEKRVITMIAKGYENKQIAVELGISVHTVKNHVLSIMDKLEANNRTHAVYIYFIAGQVE